MPETPMLERTLSVPVVSADLTDRATHVARAFHYLQDAFVDLGELVEEYVRTVPEPDFDEPSTTDGIAADAERFLGWLCTHYGLTEEQMDVVNGERTRGTM